MHSSTAFFVLILGIITFSQLGFSNPIHANSFDTPPAYFHDLPGVDNYLIKKRPAESNGDLSSIDTIGIDSNAAQSDFAFDGGFPSLDTSGVDSSAPDTKVSNRLPIRFLES